MALAIINSCAQAGIDSLEVSVEVHLSPGLPAFTIVGLAETAVKESKDRVRSAILNAGFEFPAKRITVNLAPADLPKEGGRYDLPIAVGILIASNQVRDEGIESLEFIGELALGGALRGISGVLPSVLAATRWGRAAIVPHANVETAALASGSEIYPATHLLEVTAHLNGIEKLSPLEAEVKSSPPEAPDLADVKGQALAKRALSIAAAGGHNLLLAGPPGSGKTMLARRLHGVLPPLTEEEALTTASIWSLTPAGFDTAEWRRRPFRSPHHSASAAALCGGGSQPVPGEISLAHNGVLFLDELPEFAPRVLDQLREPLETGVVHIARVLGRRVYPARFMLVAAMNLCRCGRMGDHRAMCRCSEEVVRRYQQRVSGPLLDRIDIQVHVKPVTTRELEDSTTATPETPAVRQRVIEARQRQLERQGCSNAELDSGGIRLHCRLGGEAARLLNRATEQNLLSARGYHRTLKVARSIADFEAAEDIRPGHVAEAIQYRHQDNAT